MTLVITTLGLLGMALMTLSYACKNDRTLRLINVAGILVWMLHFGLLGAWSVTIMLFVGLLILVSALLGKLAIAKTLIYACGLGVPLSALAWMTGLVGFDLPMAMLITFCLNAGIVLLDGHKLSLAVSVAVFLNIILSLMVGSWTGAMTNALNLGGILVRTWKLITDSPPKTAVV